MASVGFNYARIHVQQKHLREKVKKREQEEKPAARREKAHQERKPSHKVYPGGVAAAEPAGGAGKGAAAPFGISMK